MDNFDITKYINMAIKRRWWIIIPFLLSILGGMTYLLITPKIYEAETLILVQSQRVPEDFVRSIVSATIDDRLRNISQQVQSRTNLEKIIEDYGLYSSEIDMLIDEKVALLRKTISIDVSKDNSRRDAETSAFTISFQGDNPRKVMDVTNALASNFISENLKIREEQALGTSSFLADELNSKEAQLEEKEEELKKYREQYMGGLPEQLDTNLSILERLQAQAEQYNSNLREAETRKAAIIRDIAAASESMLSLPTGQPGQPAMVNDLTSLKNQLAGLQSRYTENHPEVIRLKGMIERLEKEREQAAADNAESADNEMPVTGMVSQALKNQLQQVEMDIARLKAEITETVNQIKYYQKKVEETPKREQELVGLNRDYDNLNELYSSLLNRKLEAEISLSMEKKQKGEQFKIIDPAKMPVKPVKPDVKKIILMTLALGLGIGCGLAFMLDYMDTSLKAPEDAEKELQLPVLVNIPLLTTEREIGKKRRREVLAAVCVTIGFFISAAGIVVTIKGFDTTVGYLKGIF